MNKYILISLFGISILILIIIFTPRSSEYQSTEIHPTDSGNGDIWTRERMENSTPLPMPVDDR